MPLSPFKVSIRPGNSIIYKNDAAAWKIIVEIKKLIIMSYTQALL
jgi:hypothetical protein